MKIIFLDIDGVISTEDCWYTKKFKINKDTKAIKMPYSWDVDCCKSLTRIIEQTRAKIVISSDWKHHYTTDDLKQMFQYYDIQNSIIGCTGNEGKMSGSYEYNRSLQIEAYLERNPEINNWVAVDDLNMSTMLKNFILISDVTKGIVTVEEEIITKLNSI